MRRYVIPAIVGLLMLLFIYQPLGLTPYHLVLVLAACIVALNMRDF